MSKVSDWVKENQGKHFCKCGCGKEIKILLSHHNPTSHIPRYINGHATRRFVYCELCKKRVWKYIKTGRKHQFCCKQHYLKWREVWCMEENAGGFKDGRCYKIGKKSYSKIQNFFYNKGIKMKGMPIDIFNLGMVLIKTKEVLNESRISVKRDEVGSVSGNS